MTQANYYLSLLKFSYEKIIEHLNFKYGLVNGSYFINNKCLSINKKIKRTNDGLFIHHIREDRVSLLSNSEVAKRYPFSYQEKENLVYCNFLEHLILHIKIFEETGLGVGGIIYFLIPELNAIYSGFKYKTDWMNNVIKNIIKDQNQYLNIIDYLLKNEVISHLEARHLPVYVRNKFKDKVFLSKLHNLSLRYRFKDKLKESGL